MDSIYELKKTFESSSDPEVKKKIVEFLIEKYEDDFNPDIEEEKIFFEIMLKSDMDKLVVHNKIFNNFRILLPVKDNHTRVDAIKFFPNQKNEEDEKRSNFRRNLTNLEFYSLIDEALQKKGVLKKVEKMTFNEVYHDYEFLIDTYFYLRKTFYRSDLFY